jgi:hypothetical protein
MAESRDQLRRALGHLALTDDVESAHANVVARVRSIRRRRRAIASFSLVAILAAIAVVATTRGARDRVIATPVTVPAPDGRPRIVASVRARGLVVLDATTGAVTTTLDDVHSAIGAVSASPDGRDVYYVTGSAGYDPTCGNARILHHSLSDADGVADAIAAGLFPAVDPTGTRLAYLACDGPSGYTDTLVVRDLLSGAQRRIPVNARESSWWATAPRWSADGSHLAMRVVQGPTGGSPLRILDLAHDSSLVAAREVGFTDAGDVFGYFGSAGQLVGAVDGATGRSQVVAMTLEPDQAVPRRTLFTTDDFPISVVADRSGHDVLALTSSPTSSALYVWSAGADSAQRFAGGFDFADWLPDATTAGSSASTSTVRATTSTTPSLSNWITPRPNPDGSISAATFNALLDSEHPSWASSPERVANTFLDTGAIDASTVATQLTALSAQAADVVVNAEGLRDDSVHAARYNLHLVRQPDQTWRLATVAWSQQCQPNRGHQNFTTELCV